MAVYNLSSLSFEKIKVLQGRRVYLFPDLSKTEKAFELWSNKAKEFNKRLPGTMFSVSDLLEQNATAAERKKGLDLADYLINFAWETFNPEPVIIALPLPKSEKGEKCAPPKNNYFFYPTNPKPKATPELWPVNELEIFFNGIELPEEPIQLTAWETIINPQLFIESHFATVKANNGKRTFLPYLNRLQELKQVLTINSN